MLEHMWLLKNLLHSVQQQQRLSFQIATGKEECFCGDAKQVQPPAIWLKEILESKKLGKIFLVQVNCFWNRDERYYKPDSWHGTKYGWRNTVYTVQPFY
jgi:hypothetical protein